MTRSPRTAPERRLARRATDTPMPVVTRIVARGGRRREGRSREQLRGQRGQGPRFFPATVSWVGRSGRAACRLPLALLIVVALPLAGCARGGATAACAEVTPFSGTARVLQELRLDRLGTVTAARDDPGASTATVVSEAEVDELVDRVRSSIVGAGYVVLAEENEGFEADFIFIEGSKAHGVARINDDLDCDVRNVSVKVAAAPGGGDSSTAATPE